ncbi:MAG: rRNA maturation RNase YbeY [Dehalococcoidia bacterium]|nr:rRNA maturation RNase YbeY [Dehalococcoidia bacterium]
MATMDAPSVGEDIYVEIDSSAGGEPSAQWFETVARDVLRAEGLTPPYEVSVILTDQETVHAMNRQYRNVDSPTDVIAFYTEDLSADAAPFILPGDGVRRIGDIVISFPQAVEQAREQGHSVQKELCLLVTHGLLHLLGYDHEAAEDAPRMRGREAALMEQFNGRHYA